MSRARFKSVLSIYFSFEANLTKKFQRKSNLRSAQTFLNIICLESLN